MKLVSKEDVIKLYDELLPWDKEELKDIFGTDFDAMSEEDILKYFGIDPIDHVCERDVLDAFGETLLEEYNTYELWDEVDNRLWEIDPSYIIDALERKARDETSGRRHDFTCEDIDRLEKLISDLKAKLNNEDKNS